MSIKPVLFLSVLISLVFASAAQTCRSYNFKSNRVFQTCNDLPVLNAFLHWTYNPANRTVNLAYRKIGATSSGWIAWAINPTGTGMDGAQALVAYQADGGNMNAYTSPIVGFRTGLQPGNLSFPVPSITAELENNEMTIFATVVLPPGSSAVNQVWQEGPLTGGSPAQHALAGANRNSKGRIDFQSGQSTSTGSGNSVVKRRNVHGVLNAVSWGTLMPLGAIIARYLKVAKSADPAWFYLHVGVQTTAYAVGVGGWATGLKLGSDSPNIQHNGHRNIGITLFVLGTLQVFALLLRPKPDHKYRLYWKIYHQTTGYVVIILSVINIFKGFNILQADKKWKNTYTGVIIALAAIAVILEAFTWIVVIKRKKDEKRSHPTTNGANGYGNRV